MVDRRAFLALLATSAGAPLFADVLDTQIQPGTLKHSAAIMREAARLAGLTWTDEESKRSPTQSVHFVDWGVHCNLMDAR